MQKKWPWLVMALALTFACLAPTLGNGWVNWDDDAYVLRNPMVQEFSGENLLRIFTTPEQVGLYHPLTILSLGLDRALAGNNPAMYHVTNLLLHLLNVSLVFLLVLRLGKSLAAAFFIALLFGMHPMHVESVAWISARKDLLYTAFSLLSLIVYLLFLEEKQRKWLWISLLVFLLAMLSKAMAFTLPIIFFLLDYFKGRKWSGKIFLEKIPFIIISIAFGIIAILGQQKSESLESLDQIPVYQTLFIGCWNLLLYSVKALIPFKLSPFHPFENPITIHGYMYLAIIPLLLMGYLIWKLRKSNRELVFGLLFFLFSIGPVLQILPFGKAIMAERYTYLSYIGLFFIMGTGLEWLLRNRKWLAIVPAVWVIGLGWLTFEQTKVWKSGDSLWSAVIQAYPDSYFAYMSRGQWRLNRMKGHPGAREDLEHSLELEPANGMAWYELGRLAEAEKNREEAFQYYQKSTQFKGASHKALTNLSILRIQMGQDPALALEDLDQAIAIKPDYSLAWLNRAIIFEMLKNGPEALKSYDETIRIEPKNALYYEYRGLCKVNQGDLSGGIADYDQGIGLKPAKGRLWYLRGKVRALAGDKEGGRADLEQAAQLKYPIPPELWDELGL